MLKQISDLYEEHKATDDAEKKKEIYAKIDKISFDAPEIVATNEYDKLLSSLGAKGTNAYTSNERVVYMNDISVNELEKWLQVESEHFGQLVLRLFHTELETVYEEFNMGQDNNGRQACFALYHNLFPGHVYGEQTTIGKAEHLKNPSMVNIHKYFDTYYRPNNIAVAMVGDIKMDETIQLIDKYFGKLEAKEVPKVEHKPAKEITGVVKDTVRGPQPANVMCDRDRLDMNVLAKIGVVKELTLEEIFNY